MCGLRDTRKENSGRPIERELSTDEKYERLKAQINLLKAENELLKKNPIFRKGDGNKKIRLSAEQNTAINIRINSSV